MRGKNFKEKNIVPLIFTQFWIRNHLNKLDWLTPQDPCIAAFYFAKSMQDLGLGGLDSHGDPVKQSFLPSDYGRVVIKL